jgi:hypothetical protein
MKKCKHITAWTDYPFVELGDTAGELAPIRHVNVISYDGDKYVTVSFEDNGSHLEVKAGYLYQKATRYGGSKQISTLKLARMGDGKVYRHHVRWEREFARRERQFMQHCRETPWCEDDVHLVTATDPIAIYEGA